jgi:hypothetical protein
MSSRCHPDFEPLLARAFSREEVDHHPASVFGLWPDLTLAYTNRRWDEFADENAGQPAIGRDWSLGARYFDAIAEPLHPYYQTLLIRAPEPGAALHPVSHQYECSSAATFRIFNMQVYVLSQRAGYVVVNSLVVERAHDPREREPHAPDADRYIDAEGLIRQCCHCRRVEHGGESARWDWVPAWVERSPREASHTICPLCFDYYYPSENDPSENDD